MPSKPWTGRILIAVLVGVTLGAALFLIPLPYYIFGPAAAVDLNAAIAVAHHAPPPGTMYLTDVNVMPGRPFFYLSAKVLPGFEIMRRSQVVPPSTSDAEFNRELGDAMKQSQQTAAVVAERAAGLPVKTRSAFIVFSSVRGSPGATCFRPHDAILRIDDRNVENENSLIGETSRRPIGTRFRLIVRRNGNAKSIVCKTFLYRGKPRFGVSGRLSVEAYSLPVHVQFRLPDVNGSSGGLMFALQIYRTLTGRRITHGQKIAGTGVIGLDGSVSPVEGVREKLEAAIKVGASVFLVPAQNRQDLRPSRAIVVLPVKSFNEALHALAALPNG